MSNADDPLTIIGYYADPGTRIQHRDSPRNASINFTRSAIEHRCIFDKVSGEVLVTSPEERRYSSIASLIASPLLADIRGLADTQARVLSKSTSHPPMPVACTVNGESGGNAYDFVLHALETPSTRTRILLIDGPAGIGKTHLIRQLAQARALRAVQSQGHPLLHVESRGQRLASLHNTIARATQLLRSRFIYSDVPHLVRMRLLDIAIDGFDELVDADGYADAWATLSSFLDEIGPGGTCILAGRDTFFDQQKFRDRLGNAANSIDLQQVQLQPLGLNEARKWLRASGWPEADTESSHIRDLMTSDSFALRPYFLKELAKSSLHSITESSASVPAFLIGSMVEREAEIIKDVLSISLSDATQGLATLLQEAALDMAEREQDEVEIDLLSILAEFAFSGAGKTNLKKLQHKIGSIALLERGSANNLRRFPHSEVLNHHLGMGILRTCAEASLPPLLRRSYLSGDLLECLSLIVDTLDGNQIRRSSDRLRAALDQEHRGDKITSNIGALLLIYLSCTDLDQPTSGAPFLDGLCIVEAACRGELQEAHLKGLSISRLDARGCNLEKIRFEDCRVEMLIADEATRLGTHSMQVGAVHEAESRVTYRDPDAIEGWVSRRSPEPASENRKSDLLDFFDRICRRAIRQFYFRRNADDRASTLLEDKRWPIIESILSEEGLLEATQRSMGGQPDWLIHIKTPRELLQPSSDLSPAGKARKRIRNFGSLQ